jgi:hypothetical protein
MCLISATRPPVVKARVPDPSVLEHDEMGGDERSFLAAGAVAMQVAEAAMSDDDGMSSSGSTCSWEAYHAPDNIVRERTAAWVVDVDGLAVSLSGKGIVKHEAVAMIGMRSELSRRLADELLRPGATVQSVVALTKRFEAELSVPWCESMRELCVGVRLVTRQQAAQLPSMFAAPLPAVGYLGGVGQHAIVCTHMPAYPHRGARLVRLLREAAEAGLLQPVAWAASSTAAGTQDAALAPPSVEAVPVVLERDFAIVRELHAAIDAHEEWVPITEVRAALCDAGGYFHNASVRSTEQSVSFVVRKCLKFARDQALREVSIEYHDDALWLDAAGKAVLQSFLSRTLSEMPGATQDFKVRWHVSRSSRARAKSTTPGADRRALRQKVF